MLDKGDACSNTPHRLVAPFGTTQQRIAVTFFNFSLRCSTVDRANPQLHIYIYIYIYIWGYLCQKNRGEQV